MTDKSTYIGKWGGRRDRSTLNLKVFHGHGLLVPPRIKSKISLVRIQGPNRVIHCGILLAIDGVDGACGSNGTLHTVGLPGDSTKLQKLLSWVVKVVSAETEGEGIAIRSQIPGQGITVVVSPGLSV